MTAWDLLAVLGAIALVVACVVFWVAATRMLAATRELADATDRFVDAAGPLAEDLRSAAGRAADEVARVEHLLDLSTGIAQRLDGTTGATYRAITTPMIKGAALAEGTKRAARRLGRPARPV